MPRLNPRLCLPRHPPVRRPTPFTAAASAAAAAELLSSSRLQMVIAGKEPKDSIRDVVALLRGNNSADACEPIVAVMRKWAKANGVKL